ncbi:MAG TPA: undecaprenyldiphospho-muramoylpentapeptide beta-N-acetylglucosaminyltransferase, partial [Actinomycetota bacterium]|nr:undecaprenyldiphospho-muramoylpentapeptide beta-N-acetylglucosaminyltransferase [Actinomycetota bacterium]
ALGRRRARDEGAHAGKPLRPRVGLRRVAERDRRGARVEIVGRTTRVGALVRGASPADMRVVIAGGGTAGHVNPAIALAEALEGDGVSFLGTATGAEARLVPAAGFTLETIDVRGFDRARPLSIVPTAARAAGAVVAAHRIVRRIRPDVVVGMGGYVSLPACAAARARRVPVVVHEQNAVFGLANRVCRRWARAVAVSFEETLADAGPRGVVTGNPVARSFVDADMDATRERGRARFELDPGRKTLLVFGGSQGARRLNDAASGLAGAWRERSDVQVLHVTGRAAHAAVERAVTAARGDGPLVYRVVAFVDGMLDAYGAADVALCRSGATTVAELGVTGVPAVLVPYPYHRDRQQERHARALERAGAAVVLDDAATDTDSVARTAGALLDDDDRRAEMRARARALGRPDAAAALARVVREAA